MPHSPPPRRARGGACRKRVRPRHALRARASSTLHGCCTSTHGGPGPRGRRRRCRLATAAAAAATLLSAAACAAPQDALRAPLMNQPPPPSCARCLAPRYPWAPARMNVARQHPNAAHSARTAGDGPEARSALLQCLAAEHTRHALHASLARQPRNIHKRCPRRHSQVCPKHELMLRQRGTQGFARGKGGVPARRRPRA